MSQQARIKRLRNRIRRNERRLAAVQSFNDSRPSVRTFVRRACGGDQQALHGVEFDELVKRVKKALDDRIEPRNIVAELATDIGIDIIAPVAVAIFLNTENRITERLADLRAELAELEKQGED